MEWKMRIVGGLIRGVPNRNWRDWNLMLVNVTNLTLGGKSQSVQRVGDVDQTMWLTPLSWLAIDSLLMMDQIARTTLISTIYKRSIRKLLCSVCLLARLLLSLSADERFRCRYRVERTRLAFGSAKGTKWWSWNLFPYLVPSLHDSNDQRTSFRWALLLEER